MATKKPRWPTASLSERVTGTRQAATAGTEVAIKAVLAPVVVEDNGRTASVSRDLEAFRTTVRQ